MAEPTLVIIPAFNEEEALPTVLRELGRRPGLDVIVIDDGSTDRTAEVAADQGVTVLSLPEHRFPACASMIRVIAVRL